MSSEARARGRRRAIATTGLAFIGLVVVVALFDRLPLAESARKQVWGLSALHYAEFDRKLPARQASDWYVGVGPGKLPPEASAPVLSPDGGFFSNEVRVWLEPGDDGAKVTCSDDGSIPTRRHTEYTGPLTLRKSTVVRCRSFRNGYQPSTTTTHTYLIDAPGTLPVLALTVDPTNLWNKYTGIYAQFRERGSEWERDAHVEFHSRRSAAGSLHIPGRLRIHGFYSRSLPKKSFRFSYEALPAAAHDPENILTWPTPAGTRTVVLGARESKVSRDELFHSIYGEAGGFASANMPVFLYLNSEPWGIYYVRERVSEFYLQRRAGLGSYDLLDAQPGKPRVLAGDRKHWDRTIQFFQNGDFSDPAVFAAAGQLIDIENFTDYWLFNIYAANFDWPHHNMNMFRRRDGDDGRWRWIAWDADAAFDFMAKGLHHDTLAWATRSSLRHDLRFNNELGLRDNAAMMSSTLIARKLLENPGHRTRFASRMSELLATKLHSQNVEQALNRIHAEIAADLDLDWQRWDLARDGYESERLAYDEDMARVRRFIHERPIILQKHFQALLDSSPPREPEPAGATASSAAPPVSGRGVRQVASGR